MTTSHYKSIASKLKFEGRAFINGKYVDAIDGGKFENINPATGNILCSVRAKKDQIYLSEYQNGIFEQSIISNIDNLPKTKCNFVIGDKSNVISKSLNIKSLEPFHSTASAIAKIAQELPMEKSPPTPIYPIHNEFI